MTNMIVDMCARTGKKSNYTVNIFFCPDWTTDGNMLIDRARSFHDESITIILKEKTDLEISGGTCTLEAN